MGVKGFLHARLKALRLTPAALARELGISPTYLYRWLGGRGFPNEKQLVLLSKRFSVSLDEILGAREAEEPRRDGRLPILAAVDCGLFNPAVLEAFDALDWIELPPDLLCHGPRTNRAEGDAYVLRAAGDSMEPLIRAGSLLVLRKLHRRAGRGAEEPESGALVAAAFDLEDEPPRAAIKLYRRSDDGLSVVLESVNRTYPPIVRPAGGVRIEGLITAILDPRGLRS